MDEMAYYEPKIKEDEISFGITILTKEKIGTFRKIIKESDIKLVIHNLYGYKITIEKIKGEKR